MMKVTKSALPYILGFFFGIVLSFFQEEMKKMNSVWDFWNFYNSVKFVFPFIFMVLLISIGTDVTAFGLEKTKKNIPAKLLSIKRWIQRERLGDFEKKIFVDKDGIFLNIQPKKKFPFYSKLIIVVDYKEKRNPILKKDFESKMKYEVARLSSMIHNSSPKSFEFASNIKLSNGISKTFEIFTFDKKEKVFWLYRKTGKPEVFWNKDEFRELEYMSFGYGEHEFEFSMKNIGIFGINFNQKYSFTISYEKSGIVLET